MAVIVFLFSVSAGFLFLLCRAADESKSEEERMLEDEEQVSYLMEYSNKKIHVKR